jgi:hypothetical protein
MSPEQTVEYLQLREAYRNHIFHNGREMTEAELGRLLVLDTQRDLEWSQRPGTVEHEVEFEQR